MDYEGLYKDLSRMCRQADLRASWARIANDDTVVIRILEFENECWMFRNELFLRGYGC